LNGAAAWQLAIQISVYASFFNGKESTKITQIVTKNLIKSLSYQFKPMPL